MSFMVSEEYIMEYWVSKGYDYCAIWFDVRFKCWCVDLRDGEGNYTRRTADTPEGLTEGQAEDDATFIDCNYQLHLLGSAMEGVWGINRLECTKGLVAFSVEHGEAGVSRITATSIEDALSNFMEFCLRLPTDKEDLKIT